MARQSVSGAAVVLIFCVALAGLWWFLSIGIALNSEHFRASSIQEAARRANLIVVEGPYATGKGYQFRGFVSARAIPDRLRELASLHEDHRESTAAPGNLVYRVTIYYGLPANTSRDDVRNSAHYAIYFMSATGQISDGRGKFSFMPDDLTRWLVSIPRDPKNWVR